MRQLLLLFGCLISVHSFCGNENGPVGARASGIAGTSLTISDAWSVQNNQAGMGFLTKAAAGIYYENRFLLPELGLSAATLALPSKLGTFGLSVRRFGYKAYNENKIGLAYSRAFGEKLSIGIQLNYQSVNFAEYYGSRQTVTAEIGVIYKPGKNITLAAHVFNPTQTKLSAYDNERIPSILRIGARYQFSRKVFLAGEVEKDIYNKPILKAGIEYQVVDVLFLRTGVSGNPLYSSFGFGLKLKRLLIDFSGRFHPVLGFTPQFSLTYQFAD
jgi:hypothetical protein